MFTENPHGIDCPHQGLFPSPRHEVGGIGQFGSAMHGGPNHPLFQGPAE
jgi:hypothetical protein